jgi:DNA-directed RNA polymerase subunit RPC12/RpoP
MPLPPAGDEEERAAPSAGTVCPSCGSEGYSGHMAGGAPIMCPSCGHIFLKPTKIRDRQRQTASAESNPAGSKA